MNCEWSLQYKGHYEYPCNTHYSNKKEIEFVIYYLSRQSLKKMSGIILRGIEPYSPFSHFWENFYIDLKSFFYGWLQNCSSSQKNLGVLTICQTTPTLKTQKCFCANFFVFWGWTWGGKKKNSGIGSGRHIIIKIDWWEKISVTVLFFHGDCNRNQNRKKCSSQIISLISQYYIYLYTIVVKNIYVLSKILKVTQIIMWGKVDFRCK